MGSKISKAVRSCGQATTTASSVAPSNIPLKLDNTTSGKSYCQDSPPHLPKVLSRDDTYIACVPPTTTTLRRRDSAPSQSMARFMTREERDRMVASFSQLLEQRLTSFDTEVLAEDMPPVLSASAVANTIQETPSDIQCLTCCESLPSRSDPKHIKDVIYPCRDCGSTYCKPCIKRMFTEACKDLTRMPPRCCCTINLHVARSTLTSAEIEIFKVKYEEWSTRKPFYCPVPACSAFIPDRLLPDKSANGAKAGRTDSGFGTPFSKSFACPACETSVCVDCRQPSHPDSLCNIVGFGTDADTAALLIAWGYKQCPKCGNGVKRMYGCNHMECRCGAHFCWQCLQNVAECGGGCEEGSEYDDDQYEPDDGESELAASNSQENIPTSTQEVPQDTTSAPSSHPVIAAERLRNLDSGSRSYWEEAGLDFGDEPSDEHIQDRAWQCHHSFNPCRISLQRSLLLYRGNTVLDCVKCWREIVPTVSTPYPYAYRATGANTRRRRVMTGGPGGDRERAVNSGRVDRGRVWQPPRGLAFRENATLGTAPHLTTSVSEGILSSSLSIRHTSPMEDICFSESPVDSILQPYGAFEERRHSCGASGVFGGDEKIELAYECSDCDLIVCKECMGKELDKINGHEEEQGPGETQEQQQERLEEQASDSDFYQLSPVIFD